LRFVLLVIVFSSVIYCKDVWYDDNLKNIEDIYLVLNVRGVEDNVWEKRMYSFMELRFLEHKINIVNSQIPKLVMDINIIDSRVEETSSFLVSLSLYNYSISEAMYYKSIADTLITKKLMTSKVFSNEIMGQSSSGNLYRDVEKSLNKLISIFLDQWYKDNPFKQF
jgi:hypothetical protein|tara:strand:- start:1876 stop:2373 length:498 start_codon:yes stop_codon:yes gene_type:complete